MKPNVSTRAKLGILFMSNRNGGQFYLCLESENFLTQTPHLENFPSLILNLILNLFFIVLKLLL